MAEEMFKAKIHWVAIDPKGDWYGMRASADGKSDGLPIPIFGGRHGDIPLEPSAGQMIADLVVDTGLTCIIDTSELTEGEKIRLLDAFADRLFRRKRDDQDPTHLFLEEADDYIPQRVHAKYAHLVYTFERIVKMGRQRGLGSTICSQRSAVVNKNVLTQVETMYVLRITSPQDRGAIEDWLEYHAGRKDILASLHELENGEAWVWSPVWLKTTKRFKFRLAETFDSRRSPRKKDRQRTPSTLADVDLGELKEQMADTIERAKADDPKELRRQVAALKKSHLALEKQIAGGLAERVVEVPVEVKVDKPIPMYPPDYIAGLEAVAGHLSLATDDLKGLIRSADKLLDHFNKQIEAEPRGAKDPPVTRPRAPVPQGAVTVAPRGIPRAPAQRSELDGSLGQGERKVLKVLSQWPEGRTHNELAFLAGYSATASTIGVILAKLRRLELVERDKPIRLSAEGEAHVGGFEELPQGPALLDYWKSHRRMGQGERRVLNALIESYPDEMTHAELGEATGYSTAASTIGVILSKLRKLGLVERGRRRIPDEFMEAIAQ